MMIEKVLVFFEEILLELEVIVNEMESGDLFFNKVLEKFECGIVFFC